MIEITIAGLGPGDIQYLSLQTLEALRSASSVLLRTERHPAVAGLAAHGIAYISCDDIYQRGDTFEAVYQSIIERIITTAEEKQSLLYAVPGDPLVAERTVQMLLSAVKTRTDITVTILPALGALNLIMETLRLDPGDGMIIADARDPRLAAHQQPPYPEQHDLYHGAQLHVNPCLPTVWLQLDSQLVVSELKVLLLDFYPPEHMVTILRALGVAGEQEISLIPLQEIDRSITIDHLTSMFVPPLPWQQRSHTITDLRRLMAMLRSDFGCPWDKEQDMLSIRRTIIEEAYEVVEAIENDAPTAIADELGDLLLNILFVAQLGAEEGVFNFDDVMQILAEKLIRRHAHVFGEVEADTAAAVLQSWEQIKAGERDKKGESSIFDDVPRALPALARSQKVQKRAARAGFDWPDFRGPLLKLHEELEELSQELGINESWPRPAILNDPLTPQPGIEKRVSEASRARLTHEAGDILFATVNLLRFLHLDAEEVMREANDRFMRRFSRVEAAVTARGQQLSDLSVAEMDEIWLDIKGDD